MKSFLLALSFLTRIPMPFIKEIASERQMASCLTFFPVVGLFIGLIVAITDSVTSRLFNISVASALDLVLLFAVTGGLHTDGLMDTVDGMLSGKAKYKMLEIMKDSRVGALGASAAILAFILKF
ncbi:MAG: adenosylcobinamide-GDP ribazoletransferase, partial [Thermovirga sp.]|nr:adenosylcobinamide-GDP ribazoletransferase [Thermovirga sp.]